MTSRSPNPDALLSFGDLSLVSDDFSQSLGDCCSPFDLGPGAHSLSSDSPFDLALSIAEGGRQIFDLTLKESSIKSSPVPDVFFSRDRLSDELHPAPQATVVSSLTVDAKTLDAKTCAGNAGLKQAAGGTSKPASTAAFELHLADIKTEATVHGVKKEIPADNPTKKSTPRVVRRSPRRNTIVATASSKNECAATKAVVTNSSISTRGAAFFAKVCVRANVASMSGAASNKKVAKKGAVVKKRAVRKADCQCHHCGRTFTKEGLKYHLDHLVCRKGEDTSKEPGPCGWKKKRAREEGDGSKKE